MGQPDSNSVSSARVQESQCQIGRSATTDHAPLTLALTAVVAVPQPRQATARSGCTGIRASPTAGAWAVAERRSDEPVMADKATPGQ